VKLIHIYGQSAWHDDAVILGNREGLIALAKAIQEALETNEAKAEFEAMVSDGEGYSIKIILNDSPWESEFWEKAAVPYTADYAKERREDAIWPG
jgi:hypothetical protein